MQKTLDSKEEVKRAFNSLVAERKAQRQKIATKEETALREQQKKTVDLASKYTPDTIVKGAAELQLDFGNTVEKLTEQLKAELNKLNELRSAIAVEHDNLKNGKDTKIAANALFILKQEQAQQLKQFQDASTEKLERLDKEMAETRAQWEKATQAFELEVKAYTEGLNKERTSEVELYKYELERKYKIEKDDFEQKKKLLIRSLEEQLQIKQKDWAKREKVLSENQEDFEKFKTKVDNFETELEEAVKKAKDKAMSKASRQMKVDAELLEKESEGNQQVAELQISGLEATIAEQKEQISQLSVELKEALGRLQALSSKALENSSN